MPDIVLTRERRFSDRLRQVFIDGEGRGTIRNGETARFPVSPGGHAVLLWIDFCRSPELAVTVGERDFHASCASNVPPLFALMYLFMPGSWIWIRAT